MATIEVCDRCEQKNTRNTKKSCEVKFFCDGAPQAFVAPPAMLCPKCFDRLKDVVIAACSPPVRRKT